MTIRSAGGGKREAPGAKIGGHRSIGDSPGEQGVRRASHCPLPERAKRDRSRENSKESQKRCQRKKNWFSLENQKEQGREPMTYIPAQKTPSGGEIQKVKVQKVQKSPFDKANEGPRGKGRRVQNEGEKNAGDSNLAKNELPVTQKRKEQGEPGII